MVFIFRCIAAAAVSISCFAVAATCLAAPRHKIYKSWTDPAPVNSPSPPGAIDWEVEHRFRLYKHDDLAVGLVVAPRQDASDLLLQDLSAQLPQISTCLSAQHGPGTDNQPSDPCAGLYQTLYQSMVAYYAGAAGVAKPFENTYWRGNGPKLVWDGNFYRKPIDGYGSKTYLRGYETGYIYPEKYTIRAKASVENNPDAQCRWVLAYADTLVNLSIPCRQAILATVPAVTKPGETSRSAPFSLFVSVISPDGRKLDFSPVTSEGIYDRLIIGIGDSYAAGEGNPDVPQQFMPEAKDPNLPNHNIYFQRRARDFWNRKSNNVYERVFDSRDPTERWWREKSILKSVKPAQWWDPVCHRSLYNQQVVAATLYAAAHPHDAVTLAAFSCSGAQVLSGLLADQLHPPGIGDFGSPTVDSNFKETAQLDQVHSALCNDALLPAGRKNYSDLAKRSKMNAAEISNAAQTGNYTQYRCANGFVPRRIDAVLLSIGGNDVDFPGVVKNLIMPEYADDPWGAITLSMAKGQLKVTPTWFAHQKIRLFLPEIYATLDEQLLSLSNDDKRPLQFIQTSYPNVFNDSDGKVCHGFIQNLKFGAMHGMLPDSTIIPRKRWRFEIDQKESEDVRDGVWKPLNETLSQRATETAKLHLSIVTYDTAFDNRGWCAGSDHKEEKPDFEFPTLVRDDTVSSGWSWSHFNPELWNPYKHRTALVRTANDVFLTQIGAMHTEFLDDLNLVNRSFNASSGMIHPTAEAHGIMGYYAYITLEQVLSGSH